MLLLKNIKLPIDTDFSNLKSIVSQTINCTVSSAILHHKSIDARKKNNLHFCCSVIVDGNLETIKKSAKKYNPEEYIEIPYVFKKALKKSDYRPIVVGFGPAGIFSALILSEAGLNPIVLEQGFDVDTRKKDVLAFQSQGNLNCQSNVQFGEGGAGTFSDGKLNTGIKDIRCRAVLKTFCNFGADDSILYNAKPHIGTDVLSIIIKNIRKHILFLGAEVRFGHKLKDIKIKNNKICSVKVISKENQYEIPCNTLVMAIGHSSRDTFFMLNRHKINMQSKAFSVGVRIEHLQEQINKTQYGEFSKINVLGAADYKLSTHLSNNRGVYTFCMCPGGYVINGASETGSITTNGMSYNSRSGKNSNSALLVSVGPGDFENKGALGGVLFQQEIERKAYNISNSYSAICQRVEDFMQNKPSTKCGKVCPTIMPSPVYGKIDDLFPDFIVSSIREALPVLDRKLSGFADADALLTGPETRSSSPVRIIRDESFCSEIKGLYPCGEGAGYAGGIMSAAVDGMKVAESIILNEYQA